MVTILDNLAQKALTTLVRLKLFMNKNDNRHDDRMVLLINMATGIIERYTGRNLFSQTYTDRRMDGSDSNELILEHYPVTTFTKLDENTESDNTESWDTVDSEKYFVDEDKGILTAVSFTFHATPPKKWRATYVAGYKIDFDNESNVSLHTLPQEIEYACQKLVAMMFNASQSEGFESVKVGDLSVKARDFITNDPELTSILDKYRKTIIA